MGRDAPVLDVPPHILEYPIDNTAAGESAGARLPYRRDLVYSVFRDLPFGEMAILRDCRVLAD